MRPHLPLLVTNRPEAGIFYSGGLALFVPGRTFLWMPILFTVLTEQSRH